MLLNTLPTQPRVTVRDGRVVIDVDWNDADELRHYFRSQGLPGTVRLDPSARIATLELWDEPDPSRVGELLDAWLR